MKDSFASRLGDLRTEFEMVARPDQVSGSLPDYNECFEAAGQVSRIKIQLGKLAIQANCRDRFDGPFCDQVHELDGDLEAAHKEILYDGIQMAKLENVNIEILERLVSDAGGDISTIPLVERLQTLT